MTAVLLAGLAAGIRWARPAVAEALHLPLPAASGVIIAAWLVVFAGIIALTYDGNRS